MPDEAPVTMMVRNALSGGLRDSTKGCHLPQSLPIFAASRQSKGTWLSMRKIVAMRRVLYDALGHFNTDDGWSMASHLAITALMALVSVSDFRHDAGQLPRRAGLLPTQPCISSSTPGPSRSPSRSRARWSMC